MIHQQQSSAVRFRFRLWLVLVLTMLSVFAVRVLPALKIETDILALLPSEQTDVETSAAVERFSQALASKVLLLVGADDIERAKLAAQAFAQELRDSAAFSQVSLEQDGLNQALLDLYRPHQAFLLSNRHVALLQADKQSQLMFEALRAAFTPTGLMRTVNFADDPLGLANDYFMQQFPAMGSARLDGKVLVAKSDSQGVQRNYVLITAELYGSPFATQIQERAMAALAAARNAAQRSIAPAQVEVVMSGTVQHAVAARERATDELSLFGTIETILVMVLLIAVFSALRPLVLGALTMALAFVAGICATHYVFGTVHVLALVFGSSLIGGVIDYSIHFFADRFRGDADWTPAAAVDHVGGAILLGLSTTLLGYVVLLLVPFPGLRQIALFCAAGLTAGCFTVLCAYPVLYKKPKMKAAWGPRLGEWLADQFQSGNWTRSHTVVALVLLVAALAGLQKVVLQDDVRALQSSPPELIAAEKRVASILQTGIESRYFLVQGETEQSVLEAESRLTQQLDQLRHADQLSSYTAISNALPSLAQQNFAHELLETKVLGEHGVLRALLQQLGFSDNDANARTQAFAAGSTPLQVHQWLASDASRSYRDLWLGRLGGANRGKFASIVSLAGVKDAATLRSSTKNLESVRLIDRVASVTEVLRSYRQAMFWLLCVVYVMAMFLLSVKYGWMEAPLLLLPSALASGVTLGLFGWWGVPVNLFTLLALWLVLGLGVDYGIFLRHGRTAMPTAVLSVSLSATTTLLAFGMLAFSATPFIRSIGLTLLCAISLSWLFAMLSCLTLSKPSPQVSEEFEGEKV